MDRRKRSTANTDRRATRTPKRRHARTADARGSSSRSGGRSALSLKSATSDITAWMGEETDAHETTGELLGMSCGAFEYVRNGQFELG